MKRNLGLEWVAAQAVLPYSNGEPRKSNPETLYSRIQDVLADGDVMTAHEIAEKLGVAVGSVTSEVSRMRQDRKVQLTGKIGKRMVYGRM